MRRSVFGCALLAAVAIAAWSCGSKDEGLDPDVDKLGRASGPIEQAPRAAQPAGMPPQGMMTAGSADGAKTVHEGDVIERIHVPNYTYLRLRVAGGGETWAAIPKTEIEVGAHVRVIESLVMRKFTSPSLGRTFDSVVFGVLEGATPSRPADAGVGAAPALPPGHPPIDR